MMRCAYALNRFKKANLFCSLEHSISHRHWVLNPLPNLYTDEMRDGKTTFALKCLLLQSSSFYLLTLIVTPITSKLINKMHLLQFK